MEDWQDVFVGTVAILIGAALLGAAIGNVAWAFELRKLRWLEAKLGRQKSRAVLGCLGIGMVALGLAIAFGFRFGR